MSVPMSQVLTTARTYLNDDNATQFPDQVLIPKVQEAHRELQEELWVVGSPLVRARTLPLHVLANIVLLNFTSTPALPADFLCPTAIFESGDSGLTYTPMTEAFYIPLAYVRVARQNWWVWQQEQIILGGSVGATDIVIDYRRQITIPVLSTDVIGILFGESYLAARAAGMAAGTLGNGEAMTAMTGLAKENLAKVIVANRGQQKPILRP